MKEKSKSLLTDTENIIHLVGIGGVSMSALAEAIKSRGVVVRGSDMKNGVYTERLRARGINVFIGHKAENADGATAVIRTSAIKDDNPEIVRAKELGIPVLERAEAWGMLMSEFPEVVCVSGTHGKTSTTAMITCIALAAGKDPEVMIGADMREIGGVIRLAKSSLFIAEACEYCNSFLNFDPTVGIILNVEEDHLDFFKDINDIVNSFSLFAKRIRPSGVLIANADDENTMKAVALSGRDAITFGFSDGADVKAENITYSNGYPSFTLSCKGEKLTDIRLSVIGEHNIKNALAAATAAITMRIPPETIKNALEAFCGVGRRMEYKGEFNGAKIYDDYAHHPSEVYATLSAVKNSQDKKVICVFQPHTYTRTITLKEKFAKALAVADKVILADIFAAREKNTLGITSEVIGSLMDGAEYISGFENITDTLSKIVTSDNIVLTMGAGDIYKVGEMLTDKNKRG